MSERCGCPLPTDREEGFRALFKGGPARILRSSPQFGFTLVAYEYLHKVRSRTLDCLRLTLFLTISYVLVPTRLYSLATLGNVFKRAHSEFFPSIHSRNSPGRCRRRLPLRHRRTLPRLVREMRSRSYWMCMGTLGGGREIWDVVSYIRNSFMLYFVGISVVRRKGLVGAVDWPWGTNEEPSPSWLVAIGGPRAAMSPGQ